MARTKFDPREPGYDRNCRQLDSYDTFITNVLAVPNVVVQRPLENTHTSAVDNNNQLQPFTLPSLPGVTFTVLHTDATPMAGDCAYRINNASIVVMIEISGIRFLFTGDANGKERGEPGTVTPTHIEARLLNLPTGSLRAEVLKVPHHGSETASTQQFIDAVSPYFVIISASTTHHLPRPAVVTRYDPNTRIVLRTDRNHASDEDHIICGRDENAAFVCDYADAFE